MGSRIHAGQFDVKIFDVERHPTAAVSSLTPVAFGSPVRTLAAISRHRPKPPIYGLGRELRTVESRSFFYQWDLSHDGKQIALVHNDGRLRIVNIEDGAEREIARDGWTLGEFVSWLPDGSGVIVDGTREEAQILRKGLLYVSLETEEVRVLRQEPNQWHVRPSISPDGHWVAFGLMVFSGNAWMIEGP